MASNDKFADAINYYYYQGKPVIAPSMLTKLDTVEAVLPFRGEKAQGAKERYRDVLKGCVTKEGPDAVYRIYGIENQSEVHYAMPVRNMLYDAMNYSAQVEGTARRHRRERNSRSSGEFLSGFYKEDRLIPVRTLVIYWGTEEWDGPRSLREMLSLPPGDSCPFVNDYHLDLMIPAEIRDFSLFRTDLRQVLEFISASEDKEAVAELLRREQAAYSRLPWDAARMIKVFSGLNVKMTKKEGEEVYDMCKGVDDMMKDAKQEGKKEGRIEGKKEGRIVGMQLINS